MKDKDNLNSLAPELFGEILNYLPNPRDRSVLAQTCKRFLEKIQPHLYSSWTYHGREHSRRSLRLFMRTVFTNPRLASQVETLEIGDWLYSPVCGGPEYVKTLAPEWKELLRLQQDAGDKEDIQLWRVAMQGYTHMNTFLKNFEIGYYEVAGLADAFIGLLIPKLPNLKTLYISMPEGACGIEMMVNTLESSKPLRILERLETIYIIPSRQPQVIS
jgi:hypothetical protein